MRLLRFLISASWLASGLCICSCVTSWGQTYDWQTLAGLGGGPGNVDGVGSAAKFFLPDDIEIDSHGNVLVLETGNRLIRKITPEGVVTTLAGNVRLRGQIDAAHMSASFSYPKSMAINSQDILFVTDGNTIRQVSPAGIVTTFAGKVTSYGYKDGKGAAAQFMDLDNIVIDSQDNLYVSDSFDYCIRKVTPFAVVTTFAGKSGTSGDTDGVGGAARFGRIENLAIDLLDQVYVSDRSGIRKVAPDGEVSSPAELQNLFFFGFAAMAFDAANNMYFIKAFPSDSQILKRTTSGVVTTHAGATSTGYRDGSAAAAYFYRPEAIVFDADGNLLVADTQNHAIRQISQEAQVTTLIGHPGFRGKTDSTGSQARFTSPACILCTSNGNVVTTEYSNGDLRQTTPAGVVSRITGGWSLAETSTYSFTSTRDMKTDVLGNLYVLEPGGYPDPDAFRKIDPDGATLLSVSQTNDGRGFGGASAVATDASGNIYIADSYNHRICKIAPSGDCTSFAGSWKKYGYVDGKGSVARLGYVEAMVADSHGNLFVSDVAGTIRKITPQAQVTTFTGKANLEGHVDGPKATARLNVASSMAIDASDHLYLTDSYESTVRKVSPDGAVTTIGGTPGVYSSADGPGAMALFCKPGGIAMGSDGSVYVTDTHNNRIVRGRIIRATLGMTGNAQSISAGSTQALSGNHTDFGAAKPGTGTVTRSFEVHSLGEESLTLIGTPRVEIRGPHATDFAVAKSPEQNIDTSTSSTLEIVFAPSGKGLRQAEVVIMSTDEQRVSFTFAIQGTGDLDLPALTLAAPAAGLVSSLSPLRVSGTVTDNIGVERVEVVLNEGTPILAQLAAGPAGKPRPFEVLVNPLDGKNTLLVTAYDTSGNMRSVARTFTFERRWLLELSRQVPPSLAAKPDLSGTLVLKADTRRCTKLTQGLRQTSAVLPMTPVQVTATPRVGHLFSHWSGVHGSAIVSGNVLSLVMPAEDVIGVTAHFIANPFTLPQELNPFPGNSSTLSFSGLMEPMEPTRWQNASVGQLGAVLTRSNGSLTGTLRLDEAVHPFNAQLFGDGSVAFRGRDGQMAAFLTLGERVLTIIWTASGLAFDVVGPESKLSRGLARPAISAPASLLDANGRAALYTLVFPAQPQSPALPAESYPQGTGYASGKLAPQGTLPLAMVLADGTSVTASLMLVTGSTAPLFVTLPTPGSKSHGGSFHGTLSFDSTQEDSDVSASSLRWFRPAVAETSAATYLYTSGWPQGLVFPAFGARYDSSLTVQQTLALGAPDLTLGNVSLDFEGGWLGGIVSLGPLNISGNTVLKIPASARGYSLTLTATAGLLKGDFSPNWNAPSSKLPTFQGVLLQKGARRGGYGFFLSNRLNDNDPRSGTVLLHAR